MKSWHLYTGNIYINKIELKQLSVSPLRVEDEHYAQKFICSFSDHHR